MAYARRSYKRKRKTYTKKRKTYKKKKYSSSKAGRPLIKGRGAYTQVKGSIGQTNTVPTFASNSGHLQISHSEFIGDIVTTSTGFLANYTLDLSPTDNVTFQWLRTIAECFDAWEIKKLGFMYKSTCSNMITTGVSPALGTVLIATNYNPLSPPFTIKQQMEQWEGTSSGRPSDDLIHMIECDPKHNAGVAKHFMRQPGQVTANSSTGYYADPRLYSMGRTTVATTGCQVGILGELWVFYQIELEKPRIQQGRYNYSFGAVSGCTPTQALGSYIDWSGENGVGMGNGAANTITFPSFEAGRYFVGLYWVEQGTPVAALYPVIVADAVTNCTFTSFYRAPVAGALNYTYQLLLFLVTINTSIVNPSITHTGTLGMTNPAMNIRVLRA